MGSDEPGDVSLSHCGLSEQESGKGNWRQKNESDVPSSFVHGSGTAGITQCIEH